jgi:hypothetical protein
LDVQVLGLHAFTQFFQAAHVYGHGLTSSIR